MIVFGKQSPPFLTLLANAMVQKNLDNEFEAFGREQH
jgi:hypothetical protein